MSFAKNSLTSLLCLAAAFVETGDFDAAVAWQEQANLLLIDAAQKRRGERQVKLFKDKKPYRDDPWTRDAWVGKKVVLKQEQSLRDEQGATASRLTARTSFTILTLTSSSMT